MRTDFSFASMIAALAAWDAYQLGYFASLTAARQPMPNQQQLSAYRSIWLEGFLHASASTAA